MRDACMRASLLTRVCRRSLFPSPFNYLLLHTRTYTGTDPHDRLPGTPDLYAQMLLALVAVKAATISPGEIEQCELPQQQASSSRAAHS